MIKGLDNDALAVTMQTYLGIQIKNFAFGVFSTTDVAARAIVDQEHDQLIFKIAGPLEDILYYRLYDNGVPFLSIPARYEQKSIEYALKNELTYVEVKSMVLGEVPIAYAEKFSYENINIAFGVSLKYMQAITFKDKYTIDLAKVLSLGFDDFKTSNGTFSVDSGIALTFNDVEELMIGVVGKNLTSPQFDFPDESSIVLKPMARIGLSYELSENLKFAMDFDLTKNETLISGYESQMLGGGFSYYPWSWLSLQAGLMRNIDDSDQAGLIYTGGIGLGFPWFSIELSGEASSQYNRIEGVAAPEYTKVELTIVSHW